MYWKQIKNSISVQVVDVSKLGIVRTANEWDKVKVGMKLFLSLGIRIYSDKKRSTDETEANALSFKRNMIDVYSNSWGPGDMGFEVEGPGPKLKKVLEKGTRLVGII